MSDIEMRARGLIAAQYKHRRVSEVRRLIDPAVPLSALDYPNQRAIKAIVAALTPPEGYVLVPEEPTVEVLTAMSQALGMEPLPPPGDEDGGYPITGSASTVRQCYAAMLAARPEVSGG